MTLGKFAPEGFAPRSFRSFWRSAATTKTSTRTGVSACASLLPISAIVSFSSFASSASSGWRSRPRPRPRRSFSFFSSRRSSRRRRNLYLSRRWWNLLSRRRRDVHLFSLSFFLIFSILRIAMFLLFPLLRVAFLFFIFFTAPFSI